jgi:hypothetical protein
MLTISAPRRGRRLPLIAAPAETPYDLYGTDTMGRGIIPFAATFPADPVTTTELIVTDNTDLAAARVTPNARIVVGPGSYNALTIGASDQNWVIDNGATFAGLGGNGFARVKITGGNVVTGTDVNPYNYTDLALRNVNVQCDDFNIGLGTLMWSRCSVIHCTIFATRTGFFVPGATANDAGIWAYDLIAAANYVSGGMDPADPGVESAFRIQSVIRTILVDNRARCGFDNGGGTADIKHTFRSHYGNQDFWMRRNLCEFGDGIYFQPRANLDPIVPNNYMGRHWVYDHAYYSTLKSAFATRNSVSLVNYPGALVADGNVAFFDLGVPPGTQWGWNGQTGDTIGSNTRNAYEAPPALGAWLAADGLPPGADH